MMKVPSTVELTRTMTKRKNRIIQLPNTTVERAFEKESELLKKVQQNTLQQALLLWQTPEPTVVLPASKKWLATPELIDQLHEKGWQILSRRTGGAPVPQVAGVLNVSHMYVWDTDQPYSISDSYERFCAALQRFFKALGIETEAHATPFSYCDGDYNINIKGQKVVGTAQRVTLGQQGEKIVLAQACILLEADLEQLIYPINLSNALNHIDEQVKADAHTCLADHLASLPSEQSLYQQLIQAFAPVA